jgi:hypothetical protein
VTLYKCGSGFRNMTASEEIWRSTKSDAYIPPAAEGFW